MILNMQNKKKFGYCAVFLLVLVAGLAAQADKVSVENMQADGLKILPARSTAWVAGAGDGVEKSENSISMRLNGKTLWRLNHNPEEGKPYVHPLATTTGQVFSDLRPTDHPWHRALWFSWKFINGINYWEENGATGKSDGQTLLLSTKRKISPENEVRVEMTLAYAPAGKTEQVMREKRSVVISPPDKNGAYTIDWASEFRALENDVVLDRTPLPGQPNGRIYGGYAGYSVRMNKDVIGGTFFSSEGLTGSKAHCQPARWMTYSTTIGGSLLFMDHPTNLRYPAKWYVAENMPYFSPSVILDGPHTLKAGKSLRLQYRLVIYPEAVDAESAEKQWKEWSAKSVTVNFLTVQAVPAGDAAKLEGFVTRDGTRLLLNGKPFRFGGGNLDYLVLANDKFNLLGKDNIGTSPECSESYYPSKVMIDDAFKTLQKMNGTVARVWSAGCQGTPLSIEPELGKFNERALRQLDYVLVSAKRHGIRLILPFCDNWEYYVGGRLQFSKWRGGKNFYTDPGCRADFKLYIKTLVERTNSITGVAYKNDPVILAWESGNELYDGPAEWENDIAGYIKSLDVNHLYLARATRCIVEPVMMLEDPALLASPHIDIYQRHYYGNWNLPVHVAPVAKAGKAFIVGEFGWDGEGHKDKNPEGLKATLRDAENDPNVSGTLFWALRGRKENGDFMPVPGSGGDWWALYYPGRTSSAKNSEADMKERVRILSAHAATMAK